MSSIPPASTLPTTNRQGSSIIASRFIGIATRYPNRANQYGHRHLHASPHLTGKCACHCATRAPPVSLLHRIRPPPSRPPPPGTDSAFRGAPSGRDSVGRARIFWLGSSRDLRQGCGRRNAPLLPPPHHVDIRFRHPVRHGCGLAGQLAKGLDPDQVRVRLRHYAHRRQGRSSGHRNF